MPDMDSNKKGYGFAVALGAVGGGLFAVLATKAIPKIMPQMMLGMMRNMMTAMGSGGMKEMKEQMASG